ncbi:MAG: dipeptidase, partial [Candidatus Omnitrophica bacterium]|nr:dipeptidase [Candidatus Omnitrophota bacterium]
RPYLNYFTSSLSGKQIFFLKETNPMTARIRKYHQIARSLLKPSQKELEHGFQLHYNSLVVDAYGFSPHASVDAERLKKIVAEGCSAIEYHDAVEEMIMTGCLSHPKWQAEFKAAWEASGLTCLMQNAGEEGQEPLRMLKRFARYTLLVELMRDFWVKVCVPEDISQAKKQNRRGLCFTCNGVPLTQSWNSVEEELAYLRVFFQLGCRMMHLTYNRRNMLGDGCGEKSNAGLSDLGQAAIREMNRVGIIVDVAHCGWQTSLQAAKFSCKPVVASHSGACGVNLHLRNKPDEVIKAIADSGGYIGVCAIPYFLGSKGDITAFLDHIDYIAKKFGPDCVAIGTDRAYVCQLEGREKTVAGPASRSRFQALWPEASLPKENDPDWEKEEQMGSLDWTCWPYFTVGLVQRGYSDQDIQKIIGLNVLRVLKANFPYEKYLLANNPDG